MGLFFLLCMLNGKIPYQLCYSNWAAPIGPKKQHIHLFWEKLQLWRWLLLPTLLAPCTDEFQPKCQQLQDRQYFRWKSPTVSIFMLPDISELGCLDLSHLCETTLCKCIREAQEIKLQRMHLELINAFKDAFRKSFSTTTAMHIVRGKKILSVVKSGTTCLVYFVFFPRYSTKMKKMHVNLARSALFFEKMIDFCKKCVLNLSELVRTLHPSYIYVNYVFHLLQENRRLAVLQGTKVAAN